MKRCVYFLKYYNDHTDSNSLRATILRAKFTNYLFWGEETEDRESEYQERINILRSEYPETRLFIDNFNHPDKTLADLQKEPSASCLP